MNLEDALGSAEGNSQSSGPWGGPPGNSQSSGLWGGPPGNSQSSGPWGGQPGSNPSTGPWGGPPGGNPSTGPWGGTPGGNPSTGPWGGPPGGNPSTGPWGGPAGQPQHPTWPGGQSSGVGGGPGPGPAVAPPQNLTVPFSLDLPNGVYHKLLITIVGCIKPNPNKIVVDLHTDKDLAFHFNPRFNEAGKKVIVRNSRIRNQWGREERECPRFPFAAGQPFEMKIFCSDQEFKVAVNQSHLLEYKHRLTDLRSIKKLNIYNDLTLSRVDMDTLP